MKRLKRFLLDLSSGLAVAAVLLGIPMSLDLICHGKITIISGPPTYNACSYNGASR